MVDQGHIDVSKSVFACFLVGVLIDCAKCERYVANALFWVRTFMVFNEFGLSCSSDVSRMEGKGGEDMIDAK